MSLESLRPSEPTETPTADVTEQDEEPQTTAPASELPDGTTDDDTPLSERMREPVEVSALFDNVDGPAIDNAADVPEEFEEPSPEDELEAEQTNEAIDRRVQAEGEPNVIRLWELVYRENYDLKHDRIELCEQLGFDPTVGGPDYQIFNRCRNRLKELVELGCQDCLVPV